MIEFIDSFSQAVVAEAMCVHPGLLRDPLIFRDSNNSKCAGI